MRIHAPCAHVPVNVSKLTSANSRYAVWYGGSLLASLVRTPFRFGLVLLCNSSVALRSLNSTTVVTPRRSMMKLVLAFVDDTKSSAVRRSDLYSIDCTRVRRCNTQMTENCFDNIHTGALSGHLLYFLTVHSHLCYCRLLCEIASVPQQCCEVTASAYSVVSVYVSVQTRAFTIPKDGTSM